MQTPSLLIVVYISVVIPYAKPTGLRADATPVYFSAEYLCKTNRVV
jgi:hypothetical protein